MSIKNIVLIGMPGSGKTTIGASLAEKLGMPFIDTDLLIEQTLGEPIHRIFACYGENRFRDVERRIIETVASIQGVVIATGGGAWMTRTNRIALSRHGTVIYLNASPDILRERIKADETVRPLLRGGASALKDLYNRRHSTYMIADIVHDIIDEIAPVATEQLLKRVAFEDNDNIQGVITHKQRLSFERGRYCDVITGNNILKDIGPILKGEFGSNKDMPKSLIVTNPIVFALCGEKVKEGLIEDGFNVKVHIMPDGEENKTMEQLKRVYSALLKGAFDRGDIIIALGGGVTGDLAGFAAATYMRGLGLVQMPTTLLAQVDSSIGGKTAINLPEGKNLVGTFYQPDLTIMDITLLRHLSGYQFRQGLAECIKYALIKGGTVFDILEQKIKAINNRELRVLNEMVEICYRIKADIVRMDEKEEGLRKILNLGHTIGHALEAASGYGSLGHGDAVALGIRAKAYIGHITGVIADNDYRRIVNILDTYDFPKEGSFDLEEIFRYLDRDKKRMRGKTTFVMPKGIGDIDIDAIIPEGLLREGLMGIGCK